MPVKATSYKDRTLEFENIVDRLRKSSPAASSLPPSHAPSSSRGVGGYDESLPSRVVQQSSSARSGAPNQTEFSKRASRIGLGIHQTSQKLSKLAKLAKTTTYFNDPTIEIQELTAVIKEDISALNSAVRDLQILCDSQNEAGVSADNAAHSITVVDNLKNSLMTATKEFKEVLTKRTEKLKSNENRKKMFSTVPKESTNPFVRQRPLVNKPNASAPGSTRSPPLWANGAGSSSELFPRNQADGESQPLLQQQQNQQQQLVPLQDNYMQSRAEALHNVESTIHELSNIFTQLATMVSQQGELAIRLVGDLVATFSISPCLFIILRVRVS
ncbi:OLC1v1037241C2 [Oldenlandia corymbosa var. corymbosa]|uniref:OLC1v1037241C2 n=1 Tax=Oldenlandia corymbosa var. corymbosa TaxID=529605 RepID=A0AAV1D0G0_OLDCO|nr:OLC1v1037241C2 [Oldenlandia corymbosa var. corymbosa]